MSPRTQRRAQIVVDVTAARGFGRHATLVRKLARAILRQLGEDGSELSLSLVGDEEMQRLNRSWRGKDRTTDVLAFAQREGEPSAVDARGILGDVVISVPTAERQAGERGHSLERELGELLVHGILHLLGYDHERSPADARRMFAAQRRILTEVGVTSPQLATDRSRRRRTTAPGRST